MNVLVFSTSVYTPEEVTWLAPFIDSLAGKGQWNFALDDCDKILRIISDSVKSEDVIRLLTGLDYQCAELSDEVVSMEILK